MGYLTRQERVILAVIFFVILFGSVSQYIFKTYPPIRDRVNLVNKDRLILRLDVNTASFEELLSVPYIGEYTAQAIIKWREEHGPFQSLEDIKRIQHIRDKNFEVFSKYLKVRLKRRGRL